MTAHERNLAIREGAQHAASHEYFSARSTGFDTAHNRAVFESGFVRGYDAACAERDARIVELERQLAEARNKAMEDAENAASDVTEPGWTGYECPNTFDDGVRASVQAIRAMKGKP